MQDAQIGDVACGPNGRIDVIWDVYELRTAVGIRDG
jgi:hypothetical protein